MEEKIPLIFTMQRVGSDAIMQACREVGRNPERGYQENISYLQPVDTYEKVIVPVRNPIERNISHFFAENGEKLLELHTLEEIWEMLIDQPAGIFMYPMIWFDDVFKPLFKFDVYRKSFNKKRGWSIFDDRYLFIQYEHMEETLPEAFGQLFGQKPGQISIGENFSNAQVAGLYERFIDWVRFPTLRWLTDSRYVKHFYSKEQIGEILAKWEL